jgi:hypothetical protein
MIAMMISTTNAPLTDLAVLLIEFPKTITATRASARLTADVIYFHDASVVITNAIIMYILVLGSNRFIYVIHSYD